MSDEITITATITATCSECGAYLSTEDGPAIRSGPNHVKVSPCEECLKKAKEEGHKEGRQEAMDEADQE